MTRLFPVRATRDDRNLSKVRLWVTPFYSVYLSPSEARELADQLHAHAGAALYGERVKGRTS